MAFLQAFGHWLPPRVVTSHELAAMIQRPPEWIVEVSGIEERRWAEESDTVAGMAVNAGVDCLSKAGVAASSLGMVIVSSASAERRFPGPAAEVALRLGADGVPAVDIPIASAGSLFGIALASRLVTSGAPILVAAAERMSAVIRSAPLDPNTAILFGDGAGACLVSADSGPYRILDSVLHSGGAGAEALHLPLAGPLVMEGLAVIMNASRKIPSAIQEVMGRCGKEPAAVDLFVMHQANLNLILRVARALNVPPERFFTNVATRGNTSSASLLIALSEAAPTAGLLCLASFGAGFHWGALAAEHTS